MSYNNMSVVISPQYSPLPATLNKPTLRFAVLPRAIRPSNNRPYWKAHNHSHDDSNDFVPVHTSISATIVFALWNTDDCAIRQSDHYLSHPATYNISSDSCPYSNSDEKAISRAVKVSNTPPIVTYEYSLH